MQLLAIFSACLLVCYASLEQWGVPGTATPDSVWCRSWLCRTDVETAQEYQEYLLATVQQAPKTVAGFAEILRRDPASALRWCDLAEALVESGQIESARYGIDRAITLAPHSAPVLLRAVNFFFRIDDVSRAIGFSRAILSQIPDYDAIIFSSYDRFELPVNLVIHEGLPVDRRPTRSYLLHLFGSERVSDAEQVWSWVNAHGFADDQLAGAYASFLLRNKSYVEASRSWADYLGARRGDFPALNRIFNGDFEMAPTGSPLDWQIGRVEGAQIACDSSGHHSGQYSLHIQFAGTNNVALSQVSQVAVVTPGSHRLEYFIKTDGITTNEGVHLRVLDPEHPSLLDLLTDPLVGTNDWRREEKTFVVSPNTHLVQVQIVRLPSQKFDNKIAGSAWIDSVRLSP